MQATEFNAIPHSGMLLIPEIYRQQWEGLSVRGHLITCKRSSSKLSEKYDDYVLGKTHG